MASKDLGILPALMDNAPVPFHYHTLDGKILGANKAELDLLGYKKSEYIGKNIVSFHINQKTIKEILAKLKQKKPVKSFKATLKAKNGTLKYVLIDSKPYTGNDGKVYSCCFTKDITTLNQAENSLKFLTKASQILSSSLEYKTTLSSVAKLAISEMADWCAIDMLNEKDQTIELFTVAHQDPQKIALAYQLRKIIKSNLNAPSGAGKVIRTGKSDFIPLVTQKMITSAVKDPQILKLVQKIGFNSVMVVPLTVQKKTIGAITFVYSESKRFYTKSDLHIAEQLAIRASLAIDNANLYEFIKNQNTRLNNMIANVPGVVWEAWGQPEESTQKIDFVSANVEKMLGFTVKEWLSTPNFWLKIVHPEDKAKAAKEASQFFESGNGGVSQFRWLKKDKKPIWVEARSSIVKDKKGKPLGMIGVTIDITEQKKAGEISQKLVTIVESSDDAIISKDLNGIITSWNKGAQKLYGFKEEEAVGKSIAILAPKDRLEELEEIMEIIKMGQSIDHFETQRVSKNGRLIDVSISISPLFDSNKTPIGASIIARDISQTKELERRKDAFIGMASHELKTPITTMKAFIQVLQKTLIKLDDPQITYYLKRTGQQLDKLTDLVANLLDLSKIQAGRLELNKEKFNLNGLISETIDNIQGISNNHQIIVEGQTTQQLIGDKDRLSQVLINLLNNAIKYSPNANKVVLKILPDKNKITIAIKDFGIGISKTHQKRIFDRFYRASGTNEKTFPGLGIGLYISSELINRHGGNIWVESQKGKGSTFFITLPLK